MEATTPSPTALIGFAIAHEVRNLLTPACAYLEMARLDHHQCTGGTPTRSPSFLPSGRYTHHWVAMTDGSSPWMTSIPAAWAIRATSALLTCTVATTAPSARTPVIVKGFQW